MIPALWCELKPATKSGFQSCKSTLCTVQRNVIRFTLTALSRDIAYICIQGQHRHRACTSFNVHFIHDDRDPNPRDTLHVGNICINVHSCHKAVHGSSIIDMVVLLSVLAGRDIRPRYLFRHHISLSKFASQCYVYVRLDL